MNRLRHLTYNLLDYGRSRADAGRMRAVRKTIKAAEADMVSVQEIYGAARHDRLAVFAELAASLRMEFRATPLGGLHPGDGELVFDPGPGVRGVGVMWRSKRIQPVPGSCRTYDRTRLHGGMALVRLRIDERVDITVASTHWAPRFPKQREDEAVYISIEVQAHGEHAIVAADWNEVFASVDPQDPDTYYDPDPYATVPWDPKNLGKATPTPDGHGCARRAAMHTLLQGGLHDPAAHTRAPWYPTTGHWHENGLAKRIDGPMTTRAVAAATQYIGAVEDPTAMDASDHLPVLLDLDLDQLAAT